MFLDVGVANGNAAVVDSSARGLDVGSTAMFEFKLTVDFLEADSVGEVIGEIVEERLEGTSAEVINEQSVRIMNTHFFQ